jgi:hypothetical protein
MPFVVVSQMVENNLWNVQFLAFFLLVGDGCRWQHGHQQQETY